MTASDRLPAHQGDGVTVYLGDAREVLAALPPGSVDCCITSPPYWGLRDYDLEPQLWGGDSDCSHLWGCPPIATIGLFLRRLRRLAGQPGAQS